MTHLTCSVCGSPVTPTDAAVISVIIASWLAIIGLGIEELQRMGMVKRWWETREGRKQ